MGGPSAILMVMSMSVEFEIFLSKMGDSQVEVEGGTESLRGTSMGLVGWIEGEE